MVGPSAQRSVSLFGRFVYHACHVYHPTASSVLVLCLMYASTTILVQHLKSRLGAALNMLAGVRIETPLNRHLSTVLNVSIGH